ncbi:N-acetylmuramoyl-L-alanine amidase [Lysobacter sp. A3-1-A15]|uniref:N-acetylmuramoyl-L-alanine amidase n=1 Tax=Novilysobacter viscosus TaxID=3098602 RepID=UPI002ED96E9D
MTFQPDRSPGPVELSTARRWLLAACLLALAGCATQSPRNPLAQWRGSPNYDARGPQAIVLHHTHMDSAQAALRTLQTRNPHGRVSAHYLVGRDGALYQLVSEDDRAWHAGASRWGGWRDLNSASIGIELDNNGREPFPAPLVDTLIALLGDITRRHGIPGHQVLAHGDIAPARKQDPGARFPWRRLAGAGFGLWPRAGHGPAPDGFDPWLALRAIGYDLRDRDAVVRAFKRRYRGVEPAAGAPLGFDPADLGILHDLQRQLLDLPVQ